MVKFAVYVINTNLPLNKLDRKISNVKKKIFTLSSH